jgi:hypothetical protein
MCLFLLRLLCLWWWYGFELLGLPWFGSFAYLFPRRKSFEISEGVSKTSHSSRNKIQYRNA